MKWLIAGGSGYIGRHIVQEFQKEEIQVVVFDKHPHSSQMMLDDGFSLVLGDIRNEESLCDLFKSNNFEGVINLAALKSVQESFENPNLYEEINFKSATRLMDLAVAYNVPNFIQSSSAAVYGSEHFGKVSERDLGKPISPYGSSKLRAESHLTALISAQKISGTSLRYFNVAGSGSPYLRDTGKSNIFPIFADQLSQGIAPIIYGNSLNTKDGTCLRDYIHVVDLAIAHIAVVKNLTLKKVSPIINLGF
jgi:UDP-glucose 4-epimerase